MSVVITINKIMWSISFLQTKDNSGDLYAECE